MLIAVVLQDYLKIKFVSAQEYLTAIILMVVMTVLQHITVLVPYMIVNVSMNRKLMNIERLLITENLQAIIGINLKNNPILNVINIKPSPASYCRSLRSLVRLAGSPHNSD